MLGLELPLTHSAIPTLGTATPSFTRATTETGQKWDDNGYLNFTALAGEIVFKGARRERNLAIVSSENFSLAAFDTVNGGNSGTIGQITFAGGAGTYILQNGPSVALQAGRTYVISAYITKGTKTGQLYLGSQSNAVYATITPTTTRTRHEILLTATTNNPYCGFVNADATTGTVIVDGYQVNDITGETDQTTIRPYVSVGVLSAPAYHGSMVDGVKCYDTDRLGNPIETSATYEAVTLNGVVGTYVSTPNATANQITGDIDLRCKAVTTAWTSGAFYSLVNKSGAGRLYELNVNAAGKPFLDINGAFDVVATDTLLNYGFVNGTAKWLRATRIAATGVVTFYSSDDGSTWTQLDQVTSTTGAINNSAQIVNIGQLAGAGGPFAGKIYQAQIYNGINGTLAVDFNASRYSGGGSTLTGSTGETWTLNGSAYIPVSNYPIVGYVPWEARTNSLLHARDLSNAAWAKVNCTGVKNAVGSDGATNSASTMTATGAAATCLQTLALAAAARSYSVKLKRKTGTGTVSICRDGVTFTNITAQINSSTYTTVKIENTSVLNPICGIKLATSGDAVYVDWNQDEAGAFSTPSIDTTTLAVARNADLLTYTGGDVANIKTLACTFSRGVGIATAGTVAALSDNTANEYSSISLTSATAVRFDGIDGGVSKWQTTASNAYTPAATSKVAYSAATNSIKMDLDGTAQTEDTVATLPAVTQVQVGHLNGAVFLNGPVNHIYGWTRNLSQSELGAIDRA
jgi:hypothetical protein